MPPGDRETRLSLRVQPNARANQLVGYRDGVWTVKIAAPPAEGKANRELVAFLSELLGISPSSLALLRGHTSRNKLVSVRGLTLEEATRRLQTPR